MNAEKETKEKVKSDLYCHGEGETLSYAIAEYMKRHPVLRDIILSAAYIYVNESNTIDIKKQHDEQNKTK